MNTKNPNIENRIARRAKSIFASFGQVISDFYLEAGIYFVGGFNAALVAWDIYTSLTSEGQPLTYAVTIAIIAFVAVEGLAVYLVGAAAKTNNGLLWFFSVVFASFFTYAHYREMSGRGGVIAQYITLAIPFFVVVGYWARTVKIDVEDSKADLLSEAKAERERRQQIEDEERQRVIKAEERQRVIEDEERKQQRVIEDEERIHKMELDRLKIDAQNEVDRIKAEGQNEVKRLKAEGQKAGQSGQKAGQMNQMARQNDTFEPANGARQNNKMTRRNDLVDLVRVEPNLGPTELAERLKEMGHSTSLSTVKRDIKELNGKVKA